MTVSLPQILDGEDKSSPLKNRLRKTYRHLRKWAKRTKTNCFRLYDRDIKAYPLAIDYYDGKFLVQYFSSNREEDEAGDELKNEVVEILSSLFETAPSHICWRSRIKRKKLEQYEKHGEEREFFTVLEHGVAFEVNLNDYLDTGLFLDHRRTRQIVAGQSTGKRLLNLFAYTGSFSVHAAVQGAAYTKTVDLSNTYTSWCKRNFALNGISLKNHDIVRADCLKFLDEEIATQKTYDLIVIDPPTLSRSKKMEGFFDVQKDYPQLIEKGLDLLAKEGVLFFSNNCKGFVFDQTLFPGALIVEITDQTLPLDFNRKKIHRCWKIAKKG